MKIENEKIYNITKYTKESIFEYGAYEGRDVKMIIGSAKYDEETEMWFTPRATIGYEIKEVI